MRWGALPVAVCVVVAAAITLCARRKDDDGGVARTGTAAPRATSVAPPGDDTRARRDAAPPAAPAQADAPPKSAVAASEPGWVVHPEDAKIATAEHTLRGRVVDTKGAPLTGVRVELRSTWLPDSVVLDLLEVEVTQIIFDVRWPEARARMTTGPDGAFALRYFDGGVRELVASVDGRPRWFAQGVTDDREHVIVIAAEGARVQGRVTRDADGAPVADARVEIQEAGLSNRVLRDRTGQRFGRPGDGYGFHWSVATQTAADGSWSFDVMPGGEFAVLTHAPGLAPDSRTLHVPAEGVVTADIRLVAGYTVVGRVVDAQTGAPIAGAWLTVGSGPTSRDALAVSDAEGKLRGEHVFGGPRCFSDLVVAAEGYASESLLGGYVDDAKPEIDLVFRLHRPASLRLRLVDPDGRPVADAIVAAVSTRTQEQKVGEVELPDWGFESRGTSGTDAGGRAWIGALHHGGAGEHGVLRVYVDGVVAATHSLPPLLAGEDRDLGDVALAPSVTLRGRVREHDGTPAGGVTVIAAQTDAEDPERHALAGAMFSPDGRRATTQPDGTFALPGLAAGVWDVCAARDFQAGTFAAGVEVRSGAAPLEIRLPLVTPLRGRVLDAQGRPCVGALVQVPRDDPLPYLFWDNARTDAAGHFSFPGFRAGRGDVLVQVDPPDSPEPPQSFQARPGEEVTLTVR